MSPAARTSMTPVVPPRERGKPARLDADVSSLTAPAPIEANAARPMSGAAAQPASSTVAQPPSFIEAAVPASEPRRAPLLLRVLSGPQRGAQVPMRHHRLLIGNLQSECDVVLDLGDERPHVCLVRASRDGWTAMAVSGDLWLDETWASPQQVQEIFSGTVLTLGQVSFCIADGATMDWDGLRLPERLLRPQAAKGATPAAADDAGWLGRWPALQALRPLIAPLSVLFARRKPRARGKLLLAALLMLGLVLAGVGAALIVTAADPVSTSLTRQDDVIVQTRAALAAVPGAGELTLNTSSQRPQGVVVGGWLRQRSDGAAVEAALRKLGLEFEVRWTAADEMQNELARRFAALRESTAGAWRYAGGGSFVLPVHPSSIGAVDAPARQALSQLEGLRMLSFEAAASDRGSAATGEPALVRYQRDGRQVQVSGLERWPAALRSPHYVVQELRLAGLRSIVLENGARYFEGAALPDGAVLTRILPDRLQLKQGGRIAEAAIDLRTQPVPQATTGP